MSLRDWYNNSFTYFSHLVTTHTQIQHTTSHYPLHSSVILPTAECQYPGVLQNVYFLDETLVSCYDLRMKDHLCWLYPHQVEGDAGTNFRMGLSGGSRSPGVWMWRLFLNLDPPPCSLLRVANELSGLCHTQGHHFILDQQTWPKNVNWNPWNNEWLSSSQLFIWRT